MIVSKIFASSSLERVLKLIVMFFARMILVVKSVVMDGASCTYLLGRKINGHVSDADIIARYVGAQDLGHT